MLEPYYDSYVAMIQMAGGVRRPVTLRAPDFRLDADELRAAVGPRTRFVLLNSPHNPTGTVLTRAELQAVADVAIEHDLVVITDEVYEHLTFDGTIHEHVPIATLPGMFERTLTPVERRQVATASPAGRSAGPPARPSWSSARARGQAVADLHLGRPAAAGDRARRSTTSRTGRGRWRATCRSAATCSATGSARSGSTYAVPRAPTSRSPTSRRWAGRTAWSSASPSRSAPVSSRSRRSRSTTADAGDQLVRWAFCKEVDVIEEALSPAGRRPTSAR